MKLTTPLLTVIIPAYQSANSLPRAIQSVLEQDFSDFELLIINNGSTDHTSEVILEAEQADPRVRGIHLAVNQRPAGGRNKGVEEARARLIAFLDADDEWLPNKLSTQVALFNNFPDTDLVFTDSWNVDVVNDTTNTQSSTNQWVLHQLEFDHIHEFPQAFFVRGEVAQSIYQKSFINMSSTMIKRESFLRTGGFNTARFGTEDVDFWVRLALTGRFIYWHRPMVRCYQGNGTSAPGIPWLHELISYHRMCLVSPDYEDLRDIAQQNLLKIYRYLIVEYALKGMPLKALQTFRESLDLGYNLRLVIYAFAAFMGPIPFRLAKGYTSARKAPILEKDIFNLEEEKYG